MKNLMRVILVSVLSFIYLYPRAMASNHKKTPPIVSYIPKLIDLRPKTERVRPCIKKYLTMVEAYYIRNSRK